jgi:hypothetical protein
MLAVVSVVLGGKTGFLPGWIKLFPEFIGVAGGILALFALAHGRLFTLYTKYVVLLAASLAVISAGAIVNDVAPGAFLSGLRAYFKYLPFFLLPALVRPLEATVRIHLRLFLGLGFLQLPIVLVQKFVFHVGVDDVAGLFAVSSALGLYQLTASGFLLQAYYDQRLTLIRLAVGWLLLLSPTLISETKGALVLFPLVVVAVSATGGAYRLQLQRVLRVATLGVGFVALFTLSYNAFYQQFTGGAGLLSFFADEQGAASYLYSGDNFDDEIRNYLRDPPRGLVLPPPEAEADPNRVRRLDGVILPLQVFRGDLVRLTLGIGIGNGSPSVVGQFSGRYSMLRSLNRSNTGLSIILWELGISGVIIFIAFFTLIFTDCVRLVKQGGFWRAMGVAWSAAVVLAIASLPYKNLLDFLPISMGFWYLSGIVAYRAALVEIIPSPRVARHYPTPFGTSHDGNARLGVRGMKRQF